MIFYTKHPEGFWFVMRGMRKTEKQIVEELKKNRKEVELTYTSLLTGETMSGLEWMSELDGVPVHAVGFVKDQQFTDIWDVDFNMYRGDWIKQENPDYEKASIPISDETYKEILNKAE